MNERMDLGFCKVRLVSICLGILGAGLVLVRWFMLFVYLRKVSFFGRGILRSWCDDRSCFLVFKVLRCWVFVWFTLWSVTLVFLMAVIFVGFSA